MNPAERVREAASSAVVRFTALLEYLDHIAKGHDGSPHVNAEDRTALNALRSALALPVEWEAGAWPTVDEVRDRIERSMSASYGSGLRLSVAKTLAAKDALEMIQERITTPVAQSPAKPDDVGAAREALAELKAAIRRRREAWHASNSGAYAAANEDIAAASNRLMSDMDRDDAREYYEARAAERAAKEGS